MQVRLILRADGRIEELSERLSMQAVHAMLGADTVDTVTLFGGGVVLGPLVMIVDDGGHKKGLPLNRAATLLYWQRCGRVVSHTIVGDAVIAPDSDFEPPRRPL